MFLIGEEIWVQWVDLRPGTKPSGLKPKPDNTINAFQSTIVAVQPECNGYLVKEVPRYAGEALTTDGGVLFVYESEVRQLLALGRKPFFPEKYWVVTNYSRLERDFETLTEAKQYVETKGTARGEYFWARIYGPDGHWDFGQSYQKKRWTVRTRASLEIEYEEMLEEEAKTARIEARLHGNRAVDVCEGIAEMGIIGYIGVMQILMHKTTFDESMFDTQHAGRGSNGWSICATRFDNDSPGYEPGRQIESIGLLKGIIGRRTR